MENKISYKTIKANKTLSDFAEENTKAEED